MKVDILLGVCGIAAFLGFVNLATVTLLARAAITMPFVTEATTALLNISLIVVAVLTSLSELTSHQVQLLAVWDVAMIAISCTTFAVAIPLRKKNSFLFAGVGAGALLCLSYGCDLARLHTQNDMWLYPSICLLALGVITLLTSIGKTLKK